MKTAEEWMSQMSGLNNPPLLAINRMAIREIQLDAMREGMRRAAIINENSSYSTSEILSAAEQLTEKDL